MVRARTGWRREVIACTLASILVVNEAVASPEVAADATVEDTERAQAEYAEASRHFAAEEYLEAARALEAAYEHDPQLDYLYQRGHALRLAGNCGAAIAVFTDVKAKVQTGSQREEVSRWIEHCRRVLDEAGGQPPVPPPELDDRAELPVQPPPPRPTPDEPAVRRDLAAGLTLGLGTATAVAGATLLIASAAAANGGGSMEDERDYERRVDRSRSLEIAGAVVLSIGAAAIVAAIVRYGILARRRNARRVSAHGTTIRF